MYPVFRQIAAVERLFNKFTGVINNKHIEIAEGPAYNGTYKRRHLLISKSDSERRSVRKPGSPEADAAVF